MFDDTTMALRANGTERVDAQPGALLHVQLFQQRATSRQRRHARVAQRRAAAQAELAHASAVRGDGAQRRVADVTSADVQRLEARALARQRHHRRVVDAGAPARVHVAQLAAARRQRAQAGAADARVGNADVAQPVAESREMSRRRVADAFALANAHLAQVRARRHQSADAGVADARAATHMHALEARARRAEQLQAGVVEARTVAQIDRPQRRLLAAAVVARLQRRLRGEAEARDVDATCATDGIVCVTQQSM